MTQTLRLGHFRFAGKREFMEIAETGQYSIKEITTLISLSKNDKI